MLIHGACTNVQNKAEAECKELRSSCKEALDLQSKTSVDLKESRLECEKLRKELTGKSNALQVPNLLAGLAVHRAHC